MGKPFALMIAILLQLTFCFFACGHAEHLTPSPGDIPQLISHAGPDDGRVDMMAVDMLVSGLSNPDFLPAMDSLLIDENPDTRVSMTRALGWMAYRLILENPDGRYVHEIAGRIERLVDTGDENVQLAAVEAVRNMLSAEIDFDPEPTEEASTLANVSVHNGYFAICMRALVGGMGSDFPAVNHRASEIFSGIGFDPQYLSNGWGKYTFDTSVGTREYAEILIESLPITIGQYIEFYLDLSDYVDTLPDYTTLPLAEFHSFDWVFHNCTAEEIIPFLNHERPIVRYAAVNGLSNLGEAAQPAIDEAYENGNARVRLELIELYNPTATSAEKFILLDEVIHDDNLTVSDDDVYAFHEWLEGDEPENVADFPFDVIGFYLKLLSSGVYSDRDRAITELGKFGPEAVEVVPNLIEILRQPDVEPYTYSFALPDYQSCRYTLHSNAVQTLGNIGPGASDAIPYITDILDDETGFCRYIAAASLYLIGHEPQEMAAYLVNGLNIEQDPGILYLLENQIIRIGPAASAAIPRLIELSDHPDMMASYFARDAIIAIDGSYDRVMQMMIDWLQSDNEQNRLTAAGEISSMKYKIDIAPAIPYFLDALDDPHEVIRPFSCQIVAEYGGYEEEIVPVIIELLDLNSDQDMYIVRILETIGRPWADDAEDAVLRMIQSDNYNNIESAMSIYMNIWGPTDKFIDTLAEMAGNPEFTGSYEAIFTLRDLGPDAMRALPALNSRLETADFNVADLIQQAIDSIEGANTAIF